MLKVAQIDFAETLIPDTEEIAARPYLQTLAKGGEEMPEWLEFARGKLVLLIGELEE